MPKRQNAPESAENVNIVDKIRKPRRKQIAREICDDYRIDINSRSTWEEHRKEYYELWAGVRNPKSYPWPNCSNVIVPMLSTACNQFHARAYQAMFSPPNVVKVLPVGSADISRAKNAESFLNWQVMNQMEEYESEKDTLLQGLPINGTEFSKTYYCSIKNRPVSEHVSALDLVLPYRTKSMETARRKAHRIWLHYDEIMDRKHRGIYKFTENIKQDVPDYDTSEIRMVADEVAGSDKAVEAEYPHLILEVHKNYSLDGGNPQPYIFTVDFDSESLLRVTSGTIEDQLGGKQTMQYFTDYHFIPNPEGFYSLGFGHFIKPLNDIYNTLLNQIIDGGTISNMPFGFYGRRAGFKKRRIELYPGKMVEVEDAKNIMFPSLPRLDQTLFQVLGIVQQQHEQFTSTSDYLMGREAKGTKTPTAHGTLAIIEQGLVTFGVITKRVFRSLRRELRLLIALDKLHLDDEIQYRVMESEDKIAFPKFARDDLRGVHDIMPTGDPTWASKQARIEEASILYQLLMTNPLITGNPELGMQPNIPAMHTVTRDVLEAYQRKNIDKILPPLPDQPVSPEVENAMFMQGETKSPVRGEDHQLHLTVHERFTLTDYYAMMPDEYKSLLKQHVQATIAMIYESAQQNRAGQGMIPAPLGGPGAGPSPQQQQIQASSSNMQPAQPPQPPTTATGGIGG